jgi:hypothetical protein
MQRAIRWDVERGVSDKIGTVSARLPSAVEVVDGVIQIASTAGFLSGRVSRNGSVSATGYMGANTGVASGRGSGNCGSGTWRAHMEGGNCMGVWTAQRRQSSGFHRPLHGGARLILRDGR